MEHFVMRLYDGGFRVEKRVRQVRRTRGHFKVVMVGPVAAPNPSAMRADAGLLPNAAQLKPRVSLEATANARAAPPVSRSKASQIIARVELALAEGRHMPAKELAAVLTKNGIDLGADPIGSLSAYLSKRGRFVSERAKGGWAIKTQRHKEEPPHDVGPSAGA